MTASHPTELLCEFVLATLSHEEMARVDDHIRGCEHCLRLVHELRESLYSPNAPHARVHVKKQLFKIVAFDRDFGSVV
ncbi:MAG: anti-sigma factor family protein, partial [Roseiflexaceae bacterium]